MQIIRQKSDNLVMYVGADLSAPDLANLGVGWCDQRVSAATCDVITVASIPTNFVPDCFTYDNGVWAVVAGKENQVLAQTNMINTLFGPVPTGVAVNVTSEYSGPRSNVIFVVTVSWISMGASVNEYEVAYRESSDVLWTSLAPTSELQSKVRDIPIGSYYARVRSKTIEGVYSAWSSELAFDVVATPSTSGATVTGLELWNQGNDYTFTGKHPRFHWNRSTNLYTPDLYDIQIQTEWHVCYRVRVINLDDSTRREFFTFENDWIYTYEDNVADGNGTPARSFKVQVADRYSDGSYSTAAEITVSNPQIAALDTFGTVTLTPNINGFVVDCALPTDLDFEGIRVWATGIPLVTISRQSQFFINATVGLHDVNIAPYDSFGIDSLNTVVVQVNVTGGLSVANVTNFAEELSKFFAVPTPVGVSWLNNTPSAGYVRVNAHMMYLNGVKVSIQQFETNNPFIYWDSQAADPTLLLSTSDQEVFDSYVNSTRYWQIGYNNSGSFQEAWSTFANIVAATGRFLQLWINNAVVSGVLQSENYSYVPGTSAEGWMLPKDDTQPAVFRKIRIVKGDGSIVLDVDGSIPGTANYYVATATDRNNLTGVTAGETCFTIADETIHRYNGSSWDLIAISPTKALNAGVTITSGGIVLSNDSKIINVGAKGVSKLDAQGLTFTDLLGKVYNYIGRVVEGEAVSGDYIPFDPPFISTPKITLVPMQLSTFLVAENSSNQFIRLRADEVSTDGFRLVTELVSATGSVNTQTPNSLLVEDVGSVLTSDADTSQIEVRCNKYGWYPNHISSTGARYGHKYLMTLSGYRVFITIEIYTKLSTDPDTSYVLQSSANMYCSAGVWLLYGKTINLSAETHSVKVVLTNVTTMSGGSDVVYREELVEGILTGLTSPAIDANNYWDYDGISIEVRYGGTLIYSYDEYGLPISDLDYVVSGSYTYINDGDGSVSRVLTANIAPPDLAKCQSELAVEVRLLSMKSTSYEVIDANGVVKYTAYDGG